ncbi:MAG TPA: serine/threonine-protein kinase [Terriglobales bacterium]|nr:serine/threonine-protein kinase [Terriglobales bacterium]
MDGNGLKPTPETGNSQNIVCAGSDRDATMGVAPAAGSSEASPKLRSIGPYRMVRLLGEGGMGQVWLAEQTAPVRRMVALKLIRVGVYDAGMLRRFESERQSLAMMEHPTIAKVFDAGATPDGQPYFVMEHVAGVPITQYCDERRLGIREHLALFMQVCEGVQHAHQKAIMHRDLKPANILVAEVDGKPVPRIIDFGLAKATAAADAADTMLTRAGAFMGTPAYMSPEQASDTADVDTRTDVYSLGVVLYELLTGSLPLGVPDYRRPIDEIFRELREVDPPRPSTKVRTTEKELSGEQAQLRGTEVRQLEAQLTGDLDWITLKAIEKDRERRYATPHELADDIQRYLRNEPIVARPASTAYRVRKYVRRHRIGVSVAALGALLLVGVGVMQAAQLRRTTRERDRADRITQFMTGMFKVSDPSETRGNTVTAREILDQASLDIDRGLASDPELQAQMMGTMGTVYNGLGLYPRAQSLLERALMIQRLRLGPEHQETLKSASTLGVVLYNQGLYDKAEKLQREVLDAQRRTLGSSHRDTLVSMRGLVGTLNQKGRFTEAEKIGRECLTTSRRVLGPDDKETIGAMNNLAFALHGERRYGDAENLFREALEGERRVKGPDHPDTLVILSNLSWTLQQENRLAEAAVVQRQALDIEARVLGPEHPNTLRSKNLLGRTLRHEGRYSEAEEQHRAVLVVQRRVLSPGHPDTTWTLELLGLAQSEEGKYAEAQKAFQEAIQAAGKGQSSNVLNNAWYNFACGAAIAGRRDEAIQILRQSVDKAWLRNESIAEDDDLKSLRGDPRFQQLISELGHRTASDGKQ